jgi:hypothetical protein
MLKFISAIAIVLAISSQSFAEVKCSAKYTATRTTRKCSGWPRVCINIPEFKEGQYIAFGNDCNQCFAEGKKQATSAGGWHIKSEWSRSCDKVPSRR